MIVFNNQTSEVFSYAKTVAACIYATLPKQLTKRKTQQKNKRRTVAKFLPLPIITGLSKKIF